MRTPSLARSSGLACPRAPSTRAAPACGGRASRHTFRCRAAVKETEVAAAPKQEKVAVGAKADQPASDRAVPGPHSESLAKVPRPPKLDIEETILMEGFGWESHAGGKWWQEVQKRLPDLKASGITHLWLPPPSQSVSPQGYLPGQLYNLSSKFGKEHDLLSLNRELLEAGIRPMSDIVINHRCADIQNADGEWVIYGDDVTHDGKKINWGQWAITSDDPSFSGTGNKDSGDDYEAAPDLDHHNPLLRASLVDWLNWLRRDVGFEGWRFDFVRGYAPEYCEEYVEKTLGGEAFHVGENFVDLNWDGGELNYNQDAARKKLCDWCDEAKVCTLFDFVLKGTLQEAVKHVQYDRLRTDGGKAPGLMGWWPSKAVTFVDNHDTGSTQQHWPFPKDHVLLGYAYILTHPGIPCLFWEHHFDWKLAKQIDELVALRKRAGIRADSKLEILAAEKDMYVARVNECVMVKLGPRYDMGQLAPNKEHWQKVAVGKDFAVWEKKE